MTARGRSLRLPAAAMLTVLAAPAPAADLSAPPAFARPLPPPVEATSFRLVNEVRVGGFVGQGTRERGSTDVNFELLSSKVTTSDDPIENVLIPRLHLGTHISTTRQTSQIYVGLTWTEDLLPDYLPGVFIEGSFGASFHDGYTREDALVTPPNRAKLGCSPLFRESLSLGYRITDNIAIMATVDHISNGGLCGNNHGLNNYGGRIAYTF